jgi:hypothetical protein
MRRSISAWVAIVAAVAGCGTTGTTSRLTHELEPGIGRSLVSDVRVASAAADADATRFLVVGRVHPWGRFDAEDLRNVEGSLGDTIRSHTPAQFRASRPALDVHLVIRRYAVAISNTGGAVLAIVAWAAVDAQRKVLFQEQFYAWSSGYLVVTVGMLKDTVHRAIVRRVATTSLALASEPGHFAGKPVTVANTSTSLEEAVSHLPDTLSTQGNAFLMSSGSNALLAIGAAVPQATARNIPWRSTRVGEPFDWPAYLESLHASK